MTREYLMSLGIDYDDAMNRFMGNSELFENFLKSFKDDTSYAQLVKALEAKDVDAAFNAAHSLKGLSGNLSMMNSGKIEFSELKDRDEVVTEGTAIVTSNISTKYLTGLLIGYVAEVAEDSNHLTKSGTLIPAADFKNIREVLVIKELKQTKEMPN